MSPWSYLSLERVFNLGKKYNVKIELIPVDLFYIFKLNNTKKVLERPLSIQKNRLIELTRWSNFLNIPINTKPKHFPVDSIKSCRFIIASNLIYDFNDSWDIASKICKALWVDEKDIGDEEVLFSIAACCGKIELLKDLFYSKKTREILKENTENALAKDLFGVPSFVFNEKLFWGQDRIFFLEEEIKKYIHV